VGAQPLNGGQGGAHGRLNRREEGGNTRSIKPTKASPAVRKSGVRPLAQETGVVLDRDIGQGHRQRSGAREPPLPVASY